MARASLGQDIGKYFASTDMRRQPFVCCRLVTSLVFLVIATGCGIVRIPFATPQSSQVLENPLFIPALDREFIWNQSVNAVDDYFRIEREDRVRLIGGVLTEGRIDTHPQIGSTLLEPWRKDSASPYEKLHATLQSLRRKCAVRVIPTEGGYLIDVQVLKELEDLDKPENATVGGATLRSDGSLVRQEGAAGRYSVTLGWIPLGRDLALEQRILTDILARLNTSGEAIPLPSVEKPEEQRARVRPSMPIERLPSPK